MKRHTKDFLLNNVFRFIQLGFILPIGIFVAVYTVRFSLFEEGLHLDNAQLAGISIFLFILRSVLIILPLVFIASMIIGSRGKAHISYTKQQIVFNVFLTIAVIAFYCFITGLWYCLKDFISRMAH